MPTATKLDGTRLTGPPDQAIRATTPVADRVCEVCGELYRGGHTCSATAAAAVLAFMAPLRAAGSLGSREQIQEELDLIAFAVRAFPAKTPDQVMRECAAYSARLTELAVLLHRVEATDRQYTRVRTQQVDRWIGELERQFKVASRLVEVARQDLALLGGAQ